MRRFLLSACLIATAAFAQTPAWVAKSNRNAQLLIDSNLRYDPEEATANGIRTLDNQIVSLLDQRIRMQAGLRKTKRELETRLAKEQDPLVKQDLQILIASADRGIRASDANHKTFLPYTDVPSLVFNGLRSLLDDQTAPERRTAALTRLKKYTGAEPGYTPIVTQAERRFREGLKTPGLLGPSKIEVEKNIANSTAFIDGIGLLLEKYKIDGYQPVFAKLKDQIAEYNDFVRREVLPRSRTDFRLPPAIYAIQLEQYGVDYTPAELEQMAHQSFTELQGEMENLAQKVAKERGLPSSDYRSVIRALKREQLTGDEILPHYQTRLAQIEDILRTQHLITLPDRPAIIRIATAA